MLPHRVSTFARVPSVFTSLALCFWLSVLAQGTAYAAGPAPANPAASQPQADPPVVVLVSLDGFRWDYIEKFHTPNLARLAHDGVRAQRLISSFPTSTFPNHFTIVTGLWPGHHGIIYNEFHDPVTGVDFRHGLPHADCDPLWSGEPIWRTAALQGKKSACMFWPGSDSLIDGGRPDSWQLYDAALPAEARVKQVLDWLALPPAQRPQVITLYFQYTDVAAHAHGVESPEVRDAAKLEDDAVGQLRAGIEGLRLTGSVNVIVLSDHGMIDIDPARRVTLDDYVEPGKDVLVSYWGELTGLWPLPPLTVEDVMARFHGREHDFHAYRREDLPARWHIGYQPRVAPVVLVAEPGATVMPKAPFDDRKVKLVQAGHGYDNRVPEMGATFVAWGPLYRHGLVIPPADNVDVYRLLCATVGLTPAPGDGKDTLVKEVMVGR